MPRRATTGYNRKYAMWLLNHAKAEQSVPQHTRRRRNATGSPTRLVPALAHSVSRICAKRLIPFLPMLVEDMERHEHLHLSEECRRQLLSMSAATADRLLHSQRKRGQRGLSTTRAGTLLKQQVPVSTYAEWEETSPVFLEVERARPLWHRRRGRLSVHDDAYRHSHWMDGMPASHASQPGGGAGCLPTRTHALPVSDDGGLY
jgi:hypothetical protein